MKVSFIGMIGLSVLGSIVLAVALVVALIYLKADDNLVRLAEGRQAFVTGQVEGQIETGLGLGLELASQTNIAQVLDTVAAASPRLKSIEVFDATGRVLFAAGPDHRRDAVPTGVLDGITALAIGQPWSNRAATGLMTGMPLVNTFGKTVGGLLLVSGRDAIDAASDAMLLDILRGCCLVAAGAAVIAILAVLVVFAGPRAGLHRAADALAGVAQGHPGPFTADPLNEVEVAVGGFRERMGVARAAIDDANRRLDSIEQ